MAYLKDNHSISRKQLILRIALISGTVLWTLFIFHNSLFPGEQSAHQSSTVLQVIRSILDGMGGSSIQITHYFVRKLAHFTEYFVLGILLVGSLRSFTSHFIKHLPTILFLGLLTPVFDEFIQTFIDGRSGQVSDVLLDFSGAACGMLVFSVILIVVNKRKARRERAPIP